MKPEFTGGNVRANCPDCNGAITTFECLISGSELGSTAAGRPRRAVRNVPFDTNIYHLLRCANRGRGGLATVFTNNNTGYRGGELIEFFPRTIDQLAIPAKVPEGVRSEFREAELCASVGAWRAGSALLRSTLEKTLKANGYNDDSLANRINHAAADGVITGARSKRAHEDIRVLGNEIVHDDWKEVTADEFDQAHHYAQRILEDFYDDRPSVEALLIEKGRIKAP